MPTLKPPSKKRSTAAKTAKKGSGKDSVAEGLIDPSDLRRIVLETANTLAPDDIETLLAGEADIRSRLDELEPGLELLKRQLDLALVLLADHLDGSCSQIPYRTISIIGAAVLYFTDELDLIPDFLPQVGRLDDAAVMVTAFELAHAGLERYCDATDRELPRAPHTQQRG
jgi:uncharacterized membrane protein YkvA (DUF1232 family)